MMGQVTGQILEMDGDGALELVFRVNSHPLLHVAREGWRVQHHDSFASPRF